MHMLSADPSPAAPPQAAVRTGKRELSTELGACAQNPSPALPSPRVITAAGGHKKFAPRRCGEQVVGGMEGAGDRPEAGPTDGPVRPSANHRSEERRVGKE